MDHTDVVREKMTEKYLLNELSLDLREEFEQHFFDCPECARDVSAAFEFVAHSRIILGEGPEPAEVHATTPAVRITQGWFAWFRPAYAAPLFALLLAVIGYQSLVALPRLRRAVNRPQLLPAATVHLLTYGANGAPLVIHSGRSFLLNVVVPPGVRYMVYRVALYDPAGNMAESLSISSSAEETWPIRFPGANWQSGAYKVTVHGKNADGQDVEVGSGSFELQVQK